MSAVASAATSGSRCEPRGQISTPGLSHPKAAMCKFHSMRHVSSPGCSPADRRSRSPSHARLSASVVRYHAIQPKRISSTSPSPTSLPWSARHARSSSGITASGSSYRMGRPCASPAPDVGQHTAGDDPPPLPWSMPWSRSSTPPKCPVPVSPSRNAGWKMWRKPSHWLDDCVFHRRARRDRRCPRGPSRCG